jgi:cobalt/nickel transport protein
VKRSWLFFVGFALVALICAGVLSYFADSDPDGLDSATLKGCEEVAGQLTGDCIAQQAGDHHMADSPLANYAVGGDDRFTGVAGVLGVLATTAVAGGLFWLLRRRPSGSTSPDGAAGAGGGTAGVAPEDAAAGSSAVAGGGGAPAAGNGATAAGGVGAPTGEGNRP